MPICGLRREPSIPPGRGHIVVMVGDYLQQKTKDVTFLVVDYSSAYNAILERPMLNSWKVATSTYHLMIKFPTDYGVGELRRSQVAAREYYVAMMEMEDQVQALNIEEHRTVTEPVEKLEEILLESSNPSQTTKIGTLANPVIRQELITFLRGNRDLESLRYARNRPFNHGAQVECIARLSTCSTEEESVRPQTRSSHSRRSP